MSAIKDRFAKASTSMHRRIFRMTGGRVAGRAFGMPVVELMTTGRRSGEERRTMVATPVTEPDRVVLVAAYHGDRRNPTWYLNLRDHPHVRVYDGSATREMLARTATPTEKAELWPSIVAASDQYAKAQERTDRDIPVVILTPA